MQSSRSIYVGSIAGMFTKGILDWGGHTCDFCLLFVPVHEIMNCLEVSHTLYLETSENNYHHDAV